MSPSLGRALLLTAALGVGGTVFCAVGWRLAARARTPSADELSSEDAQRLVAELRAVSPGVYESAFYEPRIAYTLKRGQELEAWNDRFRANELGFRAGPASKKPGVLRVVFVGDSWTFGMGVRARESFPERFAALAREHAGSARRVEAWSLALPGWNLLNELAALDFFFDRLAPDVVVLCPTPNDIDSGAQVLGNGSLARREAGADEFGESQAVVFRSEAVESFRWHARWRDALAAAHETEGRLTAHRVPFFLFFTGTWNEALVHALIDDGGVEAPYVITPATVTLGEWRLPRPIGHPTSRAHDLYARLLFDALAPELSWTRLPAGERATATAALHRRATAPAGFQQTAARLLLRRTAASIPTDFVPGEDRGEQCLNGIDARTGRAGRRALLLVRRPAGATRFAIGLRPLATNAFLYPLPVSVRIASSGGGTHADLVLRGDESDEARLAIDLPPDLAEGAAAELDFTAARSSAAPEALVGRAFVITAVRPES